MNTNIRIRPFNNKFDLFISVNHAVAHCKTFKTIENLETALPALLKQVGINYQASIALEESVNSKLRSIV